MRKLLWILAVVIILAGAGFLLSSRVLPRSVARSVFPAAQITPQAGFPTTTVRPASEVAKVSAAGNVEIAQKRYVVFEVEGTVTNITVDVGDTVAAGEVLATLDTRNLERAVRQAQLNLAASQAQLDKLQEKANPAELEAAKAALASAEEQYKSLLAGASEEELAQLRANLSKAEAALKEAQTAYDKIAWRNDIGMTPQAAALQQATADYEAAKAAYEAATKGPSAAELASAQAQVANARAQLETLLAGASEAELRAAEISVEQARLSLEEAEARLAQAELRAPIAGTVLEVNITVGQEVGAGTQAFVLADLSALKLTVNVAEVDIPRIRVGQRAEVTIDALPGRTFQGVVDPIAPASTSSQGVVNYPVTIRLTDPDLSEVRPGMTAVANLLDEEASTGWLIPTNALQQRENGTFVLVLRNGAPTPIQVTPGETQGEWTLVRSPELKAGDQVIGSVTSFLNRGEAASPRPGGFGPMFRMQMPSGAGANGPRSGP
ncbi:MAG: efflux RND transporter periplasmic adaptor subunit [Anaerolineae bacterium]|nr:efflux RND transporter periplasmic adaptor subunit [Anaerolineae bacterium]MDW8099307.1 efflux RND transporter periplasmic adaptor subunit [Anaerolineae bacterium]